MPAVARAPSTEYLVLDIETVPEAERWHPPDDTQVAFPPAWAHRIVVIGCLWLDHGYRLKRFGVLGEPAAAGTPDQRERALLGDFSQVRRRSTRPLLVTYNGRGFDLPVIAIAGAVPRRPARWYYRDKSGALPLQRRRPPRSLRLARGSRRDPGRQPRCGRRGLIGLPGKIGVDGSQVEGLYAAGDLGAIEQYCLGDVAQTALLLLRFRSCRAACPGRLYRGTHRRAARRARERTRARRRVATGADRVHLRREARSAGLASRATLAIVARELVGCALVHKKRAGIIVETEAYCGPDE